jgi:hypothetical protein
VAKGVLEGDLDTGHGHGLISGCLPSPAASGGGEEPLLMVMGIPQLPEEFQSPSRQRDIAVFVPLASDVQEHPVAVDIGNLQGPAFGQSQPAGVDGSQTDPMAEHVDAGEGFPDLIEA